MTTTIAKMATAMAVDTRQSFRREIVIPHSVKLIDDVALGRCSQVTRLTLGVGLAKIGINAFFQCKSLVEIIIPPAVKVIGIKTFVAAKSLTRCGVQ